MVIQGPHQALAALHVTYLPFCVFVPLPLPVYPMLSTFQVTLVTNMAPVCYFCLLPVPPFADCLFHQLRLGRSFSLTYPIYKSAFPMATFNRGPTLFAVAIVPVILLHQPTAFPLTPPWPLLLPDFSHI